VYVNPESDQFWIIDYRIYSPESDGKTKLDHVQDMLSTCVHQKQIDFSAVLMDSWYAAKNIMLSIDKYGKFFSVQLNVIGKWTIQEVFHHISVLIQPIGRKMKNSMARQ
jgi:hypothetical protein